jgi:2-dehydro-3-deoxygluconokinase
MWAPDEAGPVLLETAGSADIVFVGRDEADWVWGASGSEEIRALFSPSTELVIKDDSRDVEIWAGGQWYRSTPPTIEVTDPIGAGDAFAAAYLAARRGGADPVTAAGHGHRLAGHVVSHVGDQGVRDAEVYRELRA